MHLYNVYPCNAFLLFRKYSFTYNRKNKSCKADSTFTSAASSSWRTRWGLGGPCPPASRGCGAGPAQTSATRWPVVLQHPQCPLPTLAPISHWIPERWSLGLSFLLPRCRYRMNTQKCLSELSKQIQIQSYLNRMLMR